MSIIRKILGRFCKFAERERNFSVPSPAGVYGADSDVTTSFLRWKPIGSKFGWQAALYATPIDRWSIAFISAIVTDKKYEDMTVFERV